MTWRSLLRTDRATTSSTPILRRLDFVGTYSGDAEYFDGYAFAAALDELEAHR